MEAKIERIILENDKRLAAAKIAELCAADKYDALQVQGAAWHDIEDKHLAGLAAAQAQLAVMAEALELVEWEQCHIPGMDTAYLSCPWCMAKHVNGHSADCQRAAALSAAPKVVWAGPIQVDIDSYGLPVLRPIDGMTPLESLADKEFDVIVLDKGEGE